MADDIAKELRKHIDESNCVTLQGLVVIDEW